ncbi:hypothetical protein C1Y08_10635 [Pseudomonas sp. FW306-02-F02-AA]|nr:hypothetical protein C1Y07_09865 [Pseudomonas sp. FW306-02-F02-AB]PMZ10680.1 hypothetical protein C1Y06_08075 [Pseudomonas sp. FW306-02-H06C]PMZ16074.1 hypothetical protein C1Y08_10635 [Pseudomonas sp. FW306-02-F02-AA]PMZ22002.1 hypothetical protein C1Y09_11180 [Pseudomonas sp. FW306-02-F08-AA]PMZ27220.1 hypothetical protein C1Y05_14680 [Pseudomonas sp. FW306-02-F04-BA]PMZ32856.1 hypothetical protein C1X99_19070 [Pseudomonas sp. FW306-02-H06B]PMZ40041.1 hypothetical protein C1Y00_14290 [Ps
MPPLEREAVPRMVTAFYLNQRLSRFYDCFAAERGGAAFRQAPRHRRPSAVINKTSIVTHPDRCTLPCSPDQSPVS